MNTHTSLRSNVMTSHPPISNVCPAFAFLLFFIFFVFLLFWEEEKWAGKKRTERPAIRNTSTRLTICHGWLTLQDVHVSWSVRWEAITLLVNSWHIFSRVSHPQPQSHPIILYIYSFADTQIYNTPHKHCIVYFFFNRKIVKALPYISNILLSFTFYQSQNESRRLLILIES